MAALQRGGRQRNLERRAGEIRAALRKPQLEAPPLVAEAQAANASALVAVITTLGEQVARLEAELVDAFDRHPDAEILRSLPGLGAALGARVLAESGDAPDRYADARARRDHAGTAPITRASGTSRVVIARLARNKRLFDACYQGASVPSPARPVPAPTTTPTTPARTPRRSLVGSSPTNSWASSTAASCIRRSMTKTWSGIDRWRRLPLDTLRTWGI